MEPYDRHIPYNALPDLPPARELFVDDSVQRSLIMASRRLSELKGLASTLPNQSIFVNTIALREAKASSAIENIFTTDDELYQCLSYAEEEYLQGPSKEIVHYREALWKGYNDIVRDGAMTVETLIDVYREIKHTHDGIRPYQAEVVIKKRGWGSLVAETVYTPPRGKGVVEKMLSDLVDFLNDDEMDGIDPLLKMAMVHYQFEAIHPFRDGNGRTGRVLCILYLIQKGLLDLPILYISSYILQNKDAYYYNLSGVTGTRDWKSWLLFMLEAVSQTADYTIEKINSIRGLMDQTEHIIRTAEIPSSRLDIPTLFEQPYIRPRNLVSDKIKSVNTAKKYLSSLESLGLLSRVRIGKEVVWLNVGLMNILSD